MRLVSIESMLLEEFFGHKIPPYAILSHCWGEEEVSFQDIGKPGWQLKRGFLKIKLACRQAEVDGFRYAWVDTCCIDKSSSVELSEAINSMYSWYAKAAVCYVHLEDVTASPQSEEIATQIEKSKWFTRGWTLQELLAPQYVKLYHKNWSCIGTKKGLCKLLSKVTQIPELVLQDRTHLKSVSVAQRMSWAANRQTTRLEDMAYCLLGLFDVNIPLLYGEGEKAFLRLQEEISRVSDDQSLFAWDSTKLALFTPNYGVLAGSPAAFAFSGAIVPIPNICESGFSMTNKGLYIRLPLLIRDDEIIGLLHCRPKGSFSFIVGIRLLKTSNPSVFQRDPHAFIQYFPSQELAEASTHSIYIQGNQPLYAPWEVYQMFILRRIRYCNQQHDYVFSNIGSTLFDWEEDTINTNIVRTVWDRALNLSRLGFGLYDKNQGHTWIIMLLVHTKRDGTISHFTTTIVFRSSKEAVEEWNHSHFSTPSHSCEHCWGSSKDFGIELKLTERLMLNQKVIMVDVKMPFEELVGMNTS
jgi:hypothetical protein